MRTTITLSLVAGAALAALAAGAALAQNEPGRPDTRLDDGSCYAKALEAQRIADRRAEGDIPAWQGLTHAEREYLQKCGGPLPGTPVAVPGAPAPSGYYYSTPGYEPAYAPYRSYGAGGVQVITNGPVPDTPANRARYRPLSHAGRASVPAGN